MPALGSLAIQLGPAQGKLLQATITNDGPGTVGSWSLSVPNNAALPSSGGQLLPGASASTTIDCSKIPIVSSFTLSGSNAISLSGSLNCLLGEILGGLSQPMTSLTGSGERAMMMQKRRISAV